MKPDSNEKTEEDIARKINDLRKKYNEEIWLAYERAFYYGTIKERELERIERVRPEAHR